MNASVNAQEDPFGGSRACFTELVGWLEGSQAAELSHGELEDELDRRGRELLRQMFQAQLDLRAVREKRSDEVTDADGVRHGAVETGHTRPLQTIFGAVSVTRLAYRRRGHANLYPVDGQLNLPAEQHSHGLRRLAAVESSRGSFEEATAAIGRTTGHTLGKRQVETLAARAAVDVTDFYSTRRPPPGSHDEVLVISADGKGIVMRPEALRPQTARNAQAATTKLKTRLSKGEKRNRKRLAEVGAVYDLTPAPRHATDVMGGEETCEEPGPPPAAAPVAKNKWVTASIVNDAAQVLHEVFDEAERRDPTHTRTWVALVDGNNHQINRIEAEAADRGVEVTIVIDLIHVLEYLWGAAWCFFDEADPAAEDWVRHRALAILDGKARQVATGIRRRATSTALPPTKRTKADACARYLINKSNHLDYPTALASGWPIATGVIEGACRHLVKDRMDITGARWSSEGAEAVLKLRAVRTNGDFDAYWHHHLEHERARVHATRYNDGLIPAAA
ncbi:MAG: ISKra4 family transposase [Pseudonocardia sp.]|nr:ISKra4 family transposase [Pseudonocardia sp.]